MRRHHEKETAGGFDRNAGADGLRYPARGEFDQCAFHGWNEVSHAEVSAYSLFIKVKSHGGGTG